jgi:phospholipid transport system substrate-binding protein
METSLTHAGARRAWSKALAAAIVSALAWQAAPAARAADNAAGPAADAAPDAFILNLATEVLDAIRADKGIQAGDFDRVQKLVNERILPHVDSDKMTRLTVGRPWRGATPEQRAALIEQFRTLLMRTYAGALSKVSDQKVRLRPTRAQDSGNDVIVRTQIVSSQGEPVDLDYRLEKTDSGWKIYDLNILGVWLVENYKSEFLQTLNEGGIDGLIKALTDKNRKAAAGAKAP